MNKRIKFGFVFAFLCVGLPAAVFGQGVTKPKQVLSEIVKGMPTGKDQEVRVLTAEFKPGDQTVFHKHRFPVTVYILEGTFTLNLEGRKDPVVIKTGEAFVEPPNVKMTGYNRSATELLRVVIFYVSDKDTPFLDMIDMPDMPKHK
jgi:quercetin dioxygenase-like cupin family protein